MEYLYAALLLHKAGKEINDAGLTKTLTAAGVKVDEARVKATVAALKGVDIDKTLAETTIAAPASAAPAAAPASDGEATAEEAPKEEAPEEDKGKSEEEAAAGLGALFG